MKHIVSVSLGSSRRDHSVVTEILGEHFKIERIGTDGDMEKVIDLIRSLDGKVDAFGMGGIDLYIVAGKKRYMFRDAKRIRDAAKKTPIVDGSGLKNTLEKRTIEILAQEEVLDFREQKILLVCGVDRFGMAEALVETGAKVTFGDLIFSLNIPIPLKSLKALTIVGQTLAPIVSQLPFQMLYPTGDKQEVISSRYQQYYEENEVIAGDFHFIKKYLPPKVKEKIILTNTVTQDDINLLIDRGAKMLITTTPEFQGRSFGTNVMEAVLVSILQKPIEEITVDDYYTILEEVHFRPRIVNLYQEELLKKCT